MQARHEAHPPVLLHYSEDPSIERFVPHVPATNPDQPPMVWAVDQAHAPLFWFPRDCPRITCWRDDGQPVDVLGPPPARRVHAIEQGWLRRVERCRLFVYRLDPAPFSAWPEADGYWTATTEVTPRSVEEVGDLLARHADAGIELRVVPDLAPLRDAVLGSGHRFSMARMANAR